MNLSYNRKTIWIDTFYIEPEYRGRGYARRIINRVRDRFKTDIGLECFPTLYSFYRKLGFSDTGYISVDGYHEMVLIYGTEYRLKHLNELEKLGTLPKECKSSLDNYTQYQAWQLYLHNRYAQVKLHYGYPPGPFERELIDIRSMNE